MGCHCLTVQKEELTDKEQIEKVTKNKTFNQTGVKRLTKGQQQQIDVEEIKIEEDQSCKQSQVSLQSLDDMFAQKQSINKNSELIIKQSNKKFELEYQIQVTFKNDYDIKVHLVKRIKDDAQFIAYQLINNKFNHHDSFLSSLKSLFNIKHENIIQIYEYFKAPISTYIIVEYCNGNTLQKEIEMRRQNEIEFTEIELLQICKQLLLACSCIHNLKFVHLEINPSSIIVTYDENKNIIVKLEQISLLQLKKCSMLSKPQQINIKYLAPELVLSQNVDEKCDI